ncbi:unnamed protein product [Sphagnum balticum]
MLRSSFTLSFLQISLSLSLSLSLSFNLIAQAHKCCCSVCLLYIALLIRVFTKIGVHHTVKDFATRGKELKDEMKEVAPAARKWDARLSFAFVYPDRLEIFWMWQSTNELLTSAVSY